ncbi:DUF4191 domain-containing protein [Auraticoccus monumenti]|uniref:DUF4191 domain-containing protein n=1 Tax=Auraticoccus monumenti TaxID=675864 RepID=A0A1G7DX49_9ACTN|nr:DUF4191 domain-containing protein [Auraticoccus monumenti]SDE55991.1 protein of unknown function [Auraticoccus monumenti]
MAKDPDKVAARQLKQAEKARKRASTDPADMGRMRQIREAYRITHEHDPKLPFLLAAAFGIPATLGTVAGILLEQWFALPLLGLMVGLLLTMIVLVQRTKRATYIRYAGQSGSAEVALSMLPKRWISSPVVTATRHQDVVHRTLGPAGIVLIGEGEPGRLRALLASEQKKHENVAYGVPVTTLVMGDRQGQVPLAQLAKHIQKLPKAIEAHQITEVRNRLRALDAVRPKVPMPKGPVPTSMRGARQGLRGR